ncbi:unnamed protein product [Gadus morhua 'NCC']
MFSLVKQTLLLRTHNQPGARSPQPVREPAATAHLKAQPHLNRRPSPRSRSVGALLFLLHATLKGCIANLSSSRLLFLVITPFVCIQARWIWWIYGVDLCGFSPERGLGAQPPGACWAEVLPVGPPTTSVGKRLSLNAGPHERLSPGKLGWDGVKL